MKQETIFYGISKYTNVIVTLLTSSILARILSPSEFGVVSVVTVFTAFFTTISDMGLGTAVIQNKTLTEEEINDIYSFSVYAALVLGVLFALLGIPIVWFYGDSVYFPICLLLSISVFFNAANIIPNAVLMRQKSFRIVGIRLIAVSLGVGVLAVAMALAGFRFYTIVFQSILQSVFIFFWNWHNTHLKFRPRFSFQSVEKVRQYSTYQFSYSLVNYFARNLDNLLIGKVLGSVSLAYYDKGYRLMMYPVQNLTYVINPIMHPILSDYQDNHQYIYDVYTRVVKILSLLGLFTSFFCFWASEEIILIVFGSQWEASVPVFRILSLSVWPQLVSTSAGSIYQSTGSTKLMFKSGMIHFSVTIFLIVCGVLTGQLRYVALLVTISLYLRFFIDYYFLIVKVFHYSYLRFLGLFRWEILMMCALILTIFLGQGLPPSNLLAGAAVKAGLLGVVYLVAAALTGQLSYLRRKRKK